MNRESTHPTVPVALDLPLPSTLTSTPKRDRLVPQFTRASEAHSWWIRAVNRIGGELAPVGRPNGDAWWERAQRMVPGSGDPTPETREALEAFTCSLNEDAALSFIGRIAAWLDCTRMAATHLRVEQAIRERPEIVHTQLPTPVFVLGLFRSGTTILHRLLGEDPDNRTLPHWESFDPTPWPEGPVRAQRTLSRFLKLADLVSPNIKAIHPMDAYQTDECRGMFTNVFRTPQLNVQYRATGYLEWLLEQDARIAYRHHKRQLQLVYHQRPHGKRLVLKDPTHTFFVEPILDVYPNARFIFIHRDPVDTLSSICSLHAYARAVFSTEVVAHDVGKELRSSYLMERLENAVATVDQLPRGRAAHVRAPDLSHDAVGTIASAYAALGMDLGREARRNIREYMIQKKLRPGARHVHGPEGFGLDADAIRERFRGYCQRFDL